MLSKPERVDVCAHLLKICEHCQHDVLDVKGITCLFDVDSGILPAWKCTVLGRIVDTLVHEICAQSRPVPMGGRITVALHHRGGAWILAVKDEGVRAFERNAARSASNAVQGLTVALNGAYHVRPAGSGTVTAVAFAGEDDDTEIYVAPQNISDLRFMNIADITPARHLIH